MTRTDKAIIFIASGFIAMICLYLYDDTLFSRNGRQQNTAYLGQIGRISNDVRHKQNAGLQWKNAEMKLPLFEGDSIFTGEKSDSDLVFEDGSLITVNENSLVVLHRDMNKEITLDLEFGNFVGNIADNSTIQIKSGEEKYSLRGDKARIRISRQKTGKSKVIVLQGKAEIKNNSVTKIVENHQEIDFHKNFSESKIQTLSEESIAQLELPAAEEKQMPPPAVIKEIPAEIQLKDQLIVFSHYDKDRPLEINWNSQGSFDNFEVIVATDSNFKNILFQETSATNPLLTQSYPNEGQLYYRVQGLNKANNKFIQSPDGKLRILGSGPTTWVTPREDIVLPKRQDEIQKSSQLEPIEFQWKNEYSNKGYLLEISTDASFMKTIVKTEVSTNTFRFNYPGFGKYFARVKAISIDPSLTSNWTETRSIQILLDNNKVILPAPVLAEKNSVYEIPKDAKAAKGPVIEWKAQPQSIGYKVQISEHEDFKTGTSYSTKQPHFQWNDFSGGKYYVRVQSISPTQSYSEPSSIGIISISYSAPDAEPVPPIIAIGNSPDSQAKAQDVKLAWTAIPKAKNYKIEVSKDKQFSKVVSSTLSSQPHKSISLAQPGNYFARIAVADAQGNIQSKYSKEIPISYTFKKPLAMPNLIDPLDKMAVYIQNADSAMIWLEWKPVEQATNYTIDISTDPQFSKKKISSQIKGTRYLIKDKISEGNIYWRVRAENNEKTSHWSPVRSFNVIAGKSE